MTTQRIPSESRAPGAQPPARKACPPEAGRTERTPEGRVFLRGGLTAAQALEAIRAHRSAMSGRGGEVAKRDVKTNVSIIELNGSAGAGRLCVKEFVRGGSRRLLPRWIRHWPAVVSWRAAGRLAALGIGRPDTLGLVIGPGASSYVIMRALEGFEPLAPYVRRALGPGAPMERRRHFLRAGAEFLGRCCSARVFHSDFKASNVFVRETESGAPALSGVEGPALSGVEGPALSGVEGWEFSLLDLAAVRFPRRIRLEHKLRNLAQLNSTIPLEVTWTDRMRFLRLLAEREPALMDRSAMAEIARLTRARGCVWRK